MTTTTDILIARLNDTPKQSENTTLAHSLLLGFDTETTGTDADDAIASASLVLRDPNSGHEGDTIAEWLVNPHHRMSPGASKVNGYTDAFLEAQGAEPTEAIDEIGKAIRLAQAKSIPLLAYNVPFDVRMLRGDLKRWDLPALPDELIVVDPLVIDRTVSKRSGKRTLTYTTEYYGVEPHGDFHDATADTIAAVDLIAPMCELYPQVCNLKLGELMDWQRKAFAAWRDSFNDWLMSKGRRPVNDEWL